MNIRDYAVTRTSNTARASAILGSAAPYWAGRADLRLMGELCLYFALASLWKLMAGYAGLDSVGQRAFVGFGDYMLFALTMFGGLHPIAAIGAAGVLGALISVPVAFLIFRLPFAQISSLGGGSGSSLPIAIV
ncbi:hypothetical protein KMP13_17315 [Epibacterium ulvae]|uniref:hypothetical protein n=1 Tax=Epibacterium ulvae TaxID=1156985 RepID=UPI001BFC9907|nr:hypothetical protein [Epibacterium ulvae]MBT8155594.1 hypothetical protein [Epibacterium ulvae]